MIYESLKSTRTSIQVASEERERVGSKIKKGERQRRKRNIERYDKKISMLWIWTLQGIFLANHSVVGHSLRRLRDILTGCLLPAERVVEFYIIRLQRSSRRLE